MQHCCHQHRLSPSAHFLHVDHLKQASVLNFRGSVTAWRWRQGLAWLHWSCCQEALWLEGLQPSGLLWGCSGGARSCCRRPQLLRGGPVCPVTPLKTTDVCCQDCSCSEEGQCAQSPHRGPLSSAVKGFQDVYNIPPVCSLCFCVQRDVHQLNEIHKFRQKGSNLQVRGGQTVRVTAGSCSLTRL